METITITVINPKTNLSKNIDATEYNFQDFLKTCNVYSKNFDVTFKRSV